jgi:hypothetical protein
MPYYDDRDALWDSVPAIEFLSFDEKNEADYIFTQILDDVEFYHMAPQDSPHWQEFKDLFGFVNDGDVWSWDDFKEWYNTT